MVLLDMLCKVVNKAWITESIPQEWEEGLICQIHKKGDPLECHNYRSITLLNIACKIFSNILYKRLLPHVERIIGNYQHGFREGKSSR
jgi:hypothetical protein